MSSRSVPRGSGSGRFRGVRLRLWELDSEGYRGAGIAVEERRFSAA